MSEQLSLFQDDAAEVWEIDELRNIRVEKRTKHGDLWKLGNHRLLCGDSTNPDDVAKLMDGESAKILFTSPPYSDMRDYNGGKDLSVSHLAKFIQAYRPYTDYQCVNLGIQRKDKAVFPYWNDYIDTATEAGYKLLSWNVWNRNEAGSIAAQRAFFPIEHEFIFVFGTEPFELNKTILKRTQRQSEFSALRQKDGTLQKFKRVDTLSPFKKLGTVLNVCQVKSDEERGYHPAPFPFELPRNYIEAMTDKTDGVIEPFCGGGTTLLVCEGLKRKCFAMELDPQYCDVILSRWERMTGEKVEKIN